MKDAIKTRELIVFEGLDTVIRGTYHKAYDNDSGTSSAQIGKNRVGVVILNSTSPTRAANGDAAVYLAESFAACGYPAFRFDLPGFGDSGGDLPEDLHGFIDRGGYATIVSEKARELVVRFNLSGVILVGHCAGSVSALYASALSAECKGLVLIGPYFFLPQTKKPAKVRRQLNLWALQSRSGRILSSTYEFFSRIRLSLQRSRVPANANYPLLHCWKKFAQSGKPILVLKGPGRKTAGAKSWGVEFDYFKHIAKLAGRKSEVTVKVTDGANNAFANRLGLEAIRQHTEEWLTACFPITGRNESSVHILRREQDKSDQDYPFARECSELTIRNGGR
jgi:pimeloyl-ACP methyl ester carboxylesterase